MWTASTGERGCAVGSSSSATTASAGANSRRRAARIELLLALRKDPGLADRLELPQHVRQEGSTRAMFERVFAEIDADGSDTVTLAEFEAYFESHEPAGGCSSAAPVAVVAAAATAAAGTTASDGNAAAIESGAPVLAIAGAGQQREDAEVLVSAPRTSAHSRTFAHTLPLATAAPGAAWPRPPSAPGTGSSTAATSSALSTAHSYSRL